MAEFGPTEGQTPTKVLHVRGLPAFTTESELASLCNAFGSVVRILLLHHKQQAFIQMDSVESAMNVVARYAAAPVSIRNKPIFFQFSNRDEVRTPNNAGVTSYAGGTGGTSGTQQQHAAPNTILLVSVLNTRVPVTLDNIHQIFKPYGEVLRIITFVKNNIFKALVQMATVESATNAKLLLEGKDMFQGCCHLRIAFSTLTELKVKADGPTSRDFTGQFSQQPQFLFSGAGQNQFGQNQYSQSLPGFAQPEQKMYQQQQQQQQPSFDPVTGAASYGGSKGEAGSVLLVNNLNPDKVTPDVLFTLFGVYGDVLRVKILFQKRDTAMIQFANAQGAYLAQLHLNHLSLYGKEINVSTSKHLEVSLPRAADSEGGNLTKDFTGSPIHRFKRSARAPKNIFAPSQVLHVSSLPDNMTEADLRKLFGEEQSGVPAVQFFQNNRKMAFVKMDSVQDAIVALIRLHNFKIADKYIRISFSQKDPAQVVDSDAPGHVDGGANGSHIEAHVEA